MSFQLIGEKNKTTMSSICVHKQSTAEIDFNHDFLTEKKIKKDKVTNKDNIFFKYRGVSKHANLTIFQG